ncbi:MAG: HIT family protein [Spirochaetales bacterium]|nr:HIT family protein [Spirochaetales bacterium]
MSKDANCGYCAEGDLLGAFGIKVCDLDYSIIVLFKEQSHPGRLIVAFKDHVRDLTALSDTERNGFFADMARVAKVQEKLFNPDKINIGAYGDTSGHLHFHLVPKYRDQFEWADIFAMNPKQTYLSDGEYDDMIGKIKKELLG